MCAGLLRMHWPAVCALASQRTCCATIAGAYLLVCACACAVRACVCVRQVNPTRQALQEPWAERVAQFAEQSGASTADLPFPGGSLQGLSIAERMRLGDVVDEDEVRGTCLESRPLGCLACSAVDALTCHWIDVWSCTG